MRITSWVCVSVLVFFSASAMAAPVTWTLTDVLFDDGGIAMGFIEFDAALAAVGPCDPVCPGLIDGSITVSGGDELTFPPFTYDATNVLAETFPPVPPRFSGHIFTIKHLSTERMLALYTASPLTDAGGVIDLIQVDGFVGSVECFNCNPFRKVVSGSLSASPVPIPSTAWLFGTTLGIILSGVRRKVVKIKNNGG